MHGRRVLVAPGRAGAAELLPWQPGSQVAVGAGTWPGTGELGTGCNL